MIRILVLGDSQASKSSIVNRLTWRGPSKTHIPVQGIEHRHKTLLHNGQKVYFQIWDTLSKDQTNPALKIYYQKANVFFLVFYLDDHQSFESISTWMNKIKEQSNPEAIIFLIGTNSVNKEKKVQPDEISQIKHKHGFIYSEVDPQNQNSYDDLLIRVIRSLHERKKSDNFLEALCEVDDEIKEDSMDHSIFKNESFPDSSNESQKKNDENINKQNLTDIVNSAVENYLKPVKREIYNEMFAGKSNIKRIETKLSDEMNAIRKELIKLQITHQTPNEDGLNDPQATKSQIFALESVSNKVHEDREKLIQLSNNLGEFRDSISEEVMQAGFHTQISFDKLSEEFEVLQNRIARFEKNSPEREFCPKNPMIESNKISELFSSQNTGYSDKFELATRSLNEEINALKERTFSNEERINEILAYLEQDFKLKQTNIIMTEVAQKDSSKSDQKSEPGLDYHKMINDLDDSIKNCIAETEDFYNNLYKGIDLNIDNQSGTSLVMKNPANMSLKSLCAPNDMTFKDNIPVNLSMDAAVRLDDNEPIAASCGTSYNVQMGRNISNSQHVHFYDTFIYLFKSLPTAVGQLRSSLSLFKKAISNSQIMNSNTNDKENIQNLGNLNFKASSSNEEPKERSSKNETTQEFSLFPREHDKSNTSVEILIKDTQVEVEKIKVELETVKNNSRISFDDKQDMSQKEIKSSFLSLREDVQGQIVQMQKDFQNVYSALKDMILAHYQDSLVKIGFERDQLRELIQVKCRELKSELDGPTMRPFGLNRIETVPSEVHIPGNMSPNDEFSLVELKMFEKRVSNAQDEDFNTREYVKKIERKQEELSLLSITLSKTYWGTINLLAERCAKIEAKLGIKR